VAGTVVVLFTDIVGSTQLLSRLGDDAFDGLRHAHFEMLEREVIAHDGEVVKGLGDGIMATFGGASDAVAAAVAIQRGVNASGRAPGDPRVSIRVGVSAGDAAREGDDWFGAPVVEGARLCAVAAPGQILVSEVVRLLAGSRGGHEFVSVGRLELKGLPDEVAASEVVWTPAAIAAAAPLPAPLAEPEGELPFSGRADVLAALRDAWEQTVTHGQRAVLVAGEPGIGKTRLVSELARSVHADGATVLLGRASEYGDAAYAVWREALRTLVRYASDEALAAHVADHGAELVRLVPALARRVPDLPEPVQVDPEIERDLLFEAVGGLLDAASADAPVLVVLDDLHWADRSSLLLLLDRLRARSAAPVLVVGTYRDTEVDRSNPLSAVLADLRREPGVARVALDGLGRAGVVELLASAGGHDLDAAGAEFARVLHQDTNGNPFFVGEVLRHLIETGGLVQEGGRWVASSTLDVAGLPEGVREVLGRRLAELPDETNRVLGVASVLGQEFDMALLSAVAEAPPGAVLDALDPAVRAQLVREVSSAPGHYVFAHALVRAVLAQELGTNRRVRLHRAAGLALEARPEPPVVRLAYHFGEAAVMGETERAVRYALAAAEESLALLAPEQAVSFARRALDAADLGEMPRQEQVPLLGLLGRALNAAGEFTEGREVLADAFTVAFAAGDLAGAHALAVEYGGFTGVFESYGDERGPAQLQAVLDALPPEDSSFRIQALMRLSTWLLPAPGSRGLDVARKAYEMAGRLGDPVQRARAAVGCGLAVRTASPPRVIAYVDEALAGVAYEDVVTDGVYPPMYLRAEARLALGDLHGAEADVRDGHLFATTRLPVRLDYAIRMWEQTLALLEGRFVDAQRCADDLGSWPGEQRLPRFGAAVGRMLLAYLRGDWAGAGECGAYSYEIEPVIMAPYPDLYAPFRSGIEGAVATLRTFREDISPLLPDWTRPVSAINLASLVRLVGDVDAARDAYEEFAARSGEWAVNTTLWCGGPYDTGLGVLAVTLGDLDTAVDHFARAVGMADAMGSPPHAVIARLELATALTLRAGPDDAARAATTIDVARRDAERVGMPGWIDRLDALGAGDPEPWRIGITD